MKGVRFYEELENKNRKGEKSKGTVVAVWYGQWWYRDALLFSAAGALFFEPNSVCCGTIASQQYLTEDTRRISEARAREIHPALFEYLER